MQRQRDWAAVSSSCKSKHKFDSRDEEPCSWWTLAQGARHEEIGQSYQSLCRPWVSPLLRAFAFAAFPIEIHSLSDKCTRLVAHRQVFDLHSRDSCQWTCGLPAEDLFDYWRLSCASNDPQLHRAWRLFLLLVLLPQRRAHQRKTAVQVRRTDGRSQCWRLLRWVMSGWTEQDKCFRSYRCQCNSISIGRSSAWRNNCGLSPRYPLGPCESSHHQSLPFGQASGPTAARQTIHRTTVPALLQQKDETDR